MLCCLPQFRHGLPAVSQPPRLVGMGVLVTVICSTVPRLPVSELYSALLAAGDLHWAFRYPTFVPLALPLALLKGLLVALSIPCTSVLSSVVLSLAVFTASSFSVEVMVAP